MRDIHVGDAGLESVVPGDEGGGGLALLLHGPGPCALWLFLLQRIIGFTLIIRIYLGCAQCGWSG